MFKQGVLNTKTSMAKFDVYFFRQLTGTIPGDVPHQSSQLFDITFVHDVEKDWATLVNNESQHCDYESSIVLTVVNATNTTRQ